MANVNTTMSADGLIKQLTTSGVSTRDAALIASTWIYQNIGQIQRVFAYGAAFRSVEPDCSDTFAQTFFHTNWIDGQDVVQAGASANDEGFNSRLHKVQRDIGALGAEIAKIYTCVANMRENLAARLEEIATELNRIDADLPTPTTTLPVNRTGRFSGIVENSQFLGLTQLDKQSVSVWKTEAGTMILPAITPLTGDPAANLNVRTASSLAAFATDAAVQNAFAAKPFSAVDFTKRFGAVTLPTGVNVADVVSTLPSTARFNSVNDLVTAVGEQQAASFRAQSGVPEVLANALKLQTQGAPLGTASVDTLSTLSDQQKNALKTAGIMTIGALASADTVAIGSAFTKAGITQVAAGDLAATKATAQIISTIR
jgi:hypothetical protein